MQTLAFENTARYRGQSSASSGYLEGHKEYAEITVDTNEDSNSAKPSEDPEKSLLREGRHSRKNSISVLKRLASTVSNELRRVASSASLTSETKPPRRPRKSSSTELAFKGLKFITKPDGVAGWPRVEKKFDDVTKETNGLLFRSNFGACIGIDSKEFALALFDVLARRQNITGGSIDKDQLQLFWEQINVQDFDSRLRLFFDMADTNADGSLNEDEVREIITLSASANKLDNIKRHAAEYAALIMETLDPNQHEYIMIDALKVLLLQAPNEAIRDSKSEEVSKLISQQLSQNRNLWERLYNGVKYFVLDNWKRVWVMALWIAVIAGLFTWKFMEYQKRSAYQVMGVCVCIAKGAGETLKLNMAIVLLPVCRKTITLLRTKTKLSVVVPFDDNLNFHKVIAIAISIGVGIHATAHLACDFPRLIAADEETYKPMEQYFGVQPKSYVQFLKSVEVVTGTAMVILMTITFTLATSWFRRNKLKSLPKPLKKITGFNAFWYTHHLFVIVYTLLVVHGYYVYLIKTWYRKTTWMYLMVPVVLYLSERLVRTLRSRIEAVSILKVGVLPGELLSLQMSRPDNFRYKSGQYMYLKCSEVSSLEWHPFSITSAPGDDYLSVHIRGLGDWTNKLRSIFSENFEVVLLVGLGIGATPMISIIKDIINNLQVNGDEEEGRVSNRNHNMVIPPTISPGRKNEMFQTKRAYFYWSTKEQGTFDWFKNVLNEVSEADVNKVIELHNYCTNVFEEEDARSALITMLQSLYHAKNGRDIVSGTRVLSQFARPKWRSIYKRIAAKHPDTRVGVFYCGAATAVKELHNLAMEFSRKTSTKFCFHKENF
ncbi:hypothetical protein Bca52824_004564 [Brassica carinata]|uniref:Uncharacterized protein n=1 Tax=Brassica carinata TaxID=52824 RepID=A0A8X8BCF2_BRACI|nr:hypothetical protein Bca52824_004564 [Brassica carinata]